MKKQFVKQTLIIALLAVSGLAFSQESVMLKYNFVKGKSYLQNTQISQTIVQSMGGQQIKILSDINATNDYQIENVESNGNASILMSLLNSSVRSAAMGRDTTMKFNDLKDKIRFVYSPDGKVVSETKVDTSDLTPVLAPIFKTARLQVIPGREIKVGEKWQDKIKENSNVSRFNTEVNNTLDYTFVGKETKDGKVLGKITFTGTLSLNGKGNQMGMEMFLEGTGKTEGFLYFDPKTSIVTYYEGQTEMDMNIAISGQQNMTIPMTESAKTIMTIQEK